MWRARASIRTRLTLLYGGMVFLAGIVLVGAGYLLVRQTLAVGLRDINTAMSLDIDSLPPEKRWYWLARLDEQRQLQDSALDRLLMYSMVAVAVVGLLSVLAGWVLARRVVNPLGHITRTARSVAGRNLGERIRLVGPDDELKELADTFDAMLERLDLAFDSQRRFAANASHELRTPLTVSRTLIQVALGRPDACAALRRLGTSLLEINIQQQEITDALLMLAHSESTRVQTRPVDLVDLARRAAGELGGEAAHAGVEVRVVGVGAPADGDPVLLESLVRNLVHNGIRYNYPGGWVHVEVGGDQGGAWLTVGNTSTKVITEAELEVIFEPFQRLGAERTGSGVGLGLSIVRSCANANGGQVTARPRPGGGLVVHFELPLHAAASSTSRAVIPDRRTVPPESTRTAGKL
jgi:signal transduction histidine kinase